MGGHGCSCAFMGAHWCSCLFDVFFPVHPFIDINIGFKRRSLSDCSTLDWIVFVFFAIHLYKGWRSQVLGKPWIWKTLCEITLMMGSNNLTNQNMSRSGWPFTCSGRNKPIKCLVTIGCIQSFLCVQNCVYNARHKIVVFGMRLIRRPWKGCRFSDVPFRSRGRVANFKNEVFRNGGIGFEIFDFLTCCTWKRHRLHMLSYDRQGGVGGGC